MILEATKISNMAEMAKLIFANEKAARTNLYLLKPWVCLPSRHSQRFWTLKHPQGVLGRQVRAKYGLERSEPCSGVLSDVLNLNQAEDKKKKDKIF